MSQHRGHVTAVHCGTCLQGAALSTVKPQHVACKRSFYTPARCALETAITLHPCPPDLRPESYKQPAPRNQPAKQRSIRSQHSTPNILLEINTMLQRCRASCCCAARLCSSSSAAHHTISAALMYPLAQGRGGGQQVAERIAHLTFLLGITTPHQPCSPSCCCAIWPCSSSSAARGTTSATPLFEGGGTAGD